MAIHPLRRCKGSGASAVAVFDAGNYQTDIGRSKRTKCPECGRYVAMIGRGVNRVLAQHEDQRATRSS